MSHSVKNYDTCIGCTQCVLSCATDILEMILMQGGLKEDAVDVSGRTLKTFSKFVTLGVKI